MTIISKLLNFSILVLFCLFFAIGCADLDEKKAEHYQKGIEYATVENYKAAIIEFRNAIQIDPKYADARYQLGLAYIKTGQPRKAFKELERAGSLDPQNTDALIKTAEMYLLGKNLKESREKIRKILEVDNNFADAYALLAYIELAENNIEAAEKSIGQAIALNPEESRYYIIHARALSAANRIEEAENALKKAVEINPESSNLNELVAFYVKQKNDSRAEQILQRFLAENPDTPEAYLDLARFYMNTGQQAEAEQNILAAIAKNPESAEIHIFLANFYRKTRAFEKAEKAYKQAIAKSKKPVDIKAMLAGFYYKTGKYELASQEVAAVLADDAQHAVASLVKAQLYIQDQKNTEALAILEKLIKNHPRWGEVYYHRGVAFIQKGEIQQSLNSVNEALKLSPDNPDALTLLAQHLFLKRDFEAAKNNSIKALQQTPGNFRAGMILAKSQLYLGETESGVKILEGMESYAPENIEILYNLSLAYLALGNIPEATDSLEKILDLNQEFTPALVAMSKIFVQQKKPDQAIALVRESLQKFPENLDYLLLLAGLLDRYGSSPEEALALLEKAQTIDPENPRAYTMAANLLVRTGEIVNAIDKYKTLTQKKPDFVEGYMALGTLLAEADNLAGAEAAYLKALEIRPDFAAVANNLAWLIANKSEPDLGEALRLALVAQNAFPEDPYIADTLGWVYYKRGAYQLALTQFSMAVEKRPDMPTLRYHLALALYADGQINQAKAELSKCLETKENFPEYSEAEIFFKKIG